MVEGKPKPTPSSSKNKVPEMIKQFQAAKGPGKFTYTAGRMDRVVNLGVAVGFVAVMYLSGKTMHQLVYGYGKRE